MNLWGITVKCTVYVGSLYLYGGPTSVSETVRLIVLLLYQHIYYMLLWRLLNFTNKNHNVIRVWISINTIHVMFYSLYYAVCISYEWQNKHSKVLKYHFLSLNCKKQPFFLRLFKKKCFFLLCITSSIWIKSIMKKFLVIILLIILKL